ncbi:hypothetical protein DERF_011463 [Dermatophagoides farinae]|uniref:Uncharacterized protein n=1 Tax=Dermatophagoides farinae TaxID=6954 RepID=A0A922HT40_DERFA|nr:hypothetical protein DERF_011463 [Dermatophagoides farinae]
MAVNGCLSGIIKSIININLTIVWHRLWTTFNLISKQDHKTKILENAIRRTRTFIPPLWPLNHLN